MASETALFTNAVDIQGRSFSIVAEDGMIRAAGGDMGAHDVTETIDLGGRCVLPGLVDGHIHLDKSFVGDRWHPHREAGSLGERLAIEKEELARAPTIEKRAEALLRQALGYGTVALRSHVDVDATTGLTNLHAIMAVRERYRDQVRIELVAFPQAGVMSCPGTAQVLEEAAREGVEVIGGLDPSGFDQAADAQLDVIFRLAERYGTRIDIHLHEPAQQGAEQLQRIARRTRAAGLNGRVAVSHAYSLGQLDEHSLATTLDQLAAADIAIMTNAPGHRPFPPLQRLREAGVRVFAGNDNIQDSWWPFGNGDMLQRAMLIAYRSGFNRDAQLQRALSMATHDAAAVLGLDDYGLQPGCRADFVVVDALNGAHAVASVPHDRIVVRGGQVVSRFPSP